MIGGAGPGRKNSIGFPRKAIVLAIAANATTPIIAAAFGTIASPAGTPVLAVADGEITTQPGFFSLCGDGVSIGRDSGSPISPDYAAPFEFAGGVIERVVVDVSGDHYVDHEKEVLAYLARD